VVSTELPRRLFPSKLSTAVTVALQKCDATMDVKNPEPDPASKTLTLALTSRPILEKASRNAASAAFLILADPSAET